MLKTGMIIAERYEIAGNIGTGGMADVYKAMDRKLNRYVAVKVLKAEFRKDATFVNKFRSEAQAAAGLTHPNIVSVYDVGDDDGIYYIVMELIEGITLKEYISKKGRLSVKEATSIAIQVCMGLEAAHNHGIVHRDVKPQNIIISTDGKVKVTDFGIARAASSNTISSNVMGSVHYSSPEQVRGGYSDEKSDIYSLGITLYEMITGKVPFDGDTTVAIAIKHLQEEMIPPNVYAPDLPFSLEQIIYKCTQKSVNRRYDRMEEVIADLKHSLIEPSGDFVRLAPVSNVAKTKVISEQELGEIKNNVKPGSPEEEEPLPAKETRKSTAGAAKKRQGGKKEEAPRQKKKKKRKSASIILPILGLMAGLALLVAVIVVVGRSAGIIPREEGGSQEQPQNQTQENPNEGLVEVPNLTGRTEAEAKNLTTQAHVGLVYAGEEPSNYEKGLISRQEIAPGSMVEEYTTIKYYISLGTAELQVPFVDGQTGIEAQTTLENAGLVVTVQKVYSDLDDNGYPVVDPGYAYDLEPAAGTTVHVGDAVTLYVSRGADYGGSVEVPEVIGMQQNEAITTLGKFLNIEVTEQMSQEVPEGNVISQSPEAYSYADPDYASVALIVSSGDRDPASAQPEVSVESDAVVAAATAAGEVWKCTQRLNTPSGYSGGPIRLSLEQVVNGQPTSTMVVDGLVLAFPYQLDLTGIPGLSSGSLYLSEQIDGSWQQLGVYNLSFKRVE